MQPAVPAITHCPLRPAGPATLLRNAALVGLAIAVAVGFVISLGLAIIAVRRRRAYGPIIAVTSFAMVGDRDRAREHLATYRKSEDLITIGAYQQGANPALDQAVALHDLVTASGLTVVKRCLRAQVRPVHSERAGDRLDAHLRPGSAIGE